jgi:hypothetical protein
MIDKVRAVMLIEEIMLEEGWSQKQLLKRLRIAHPTYNRMRDAECLMPLAPMTQRKILSFLKRHGRTL